MPKDNIEIDHIVITAADPEKTIAFYTEVLDLGFIKEIFADNRIALKFADKKFNIHPFSGKPIYPRAKNPTPGSLDICFILDRPITELKQTLESKGIHIEGPVQRTGAQGKIESIYVRDPDGNLLEFANYLQKTK